MTVLYLHAESEKTFHLPELRIVLLGASGVGKSATGNVILDRKAFKGTRTRVSEMQRGRVEDRIVSVIDTPGFFTTELTDEELQNEIKRSVSLCHPGPHVFLLMINLMNMKEEERNLVKQIQENFGPQAFKFTLVLFIGREQMSNKEWMVFMLSTKFQEQVRHCRNKYHAVNSINEINPTHITKLLQKIDEIVKQNDDQHYKTDIYLKSPTKIKKIKQCKAGYQVFNNTDENRTQVIKLLWKINTMVKDNGGEHYTNQMYQEAQRKIREEEERHREEDERLKQEEELKIRKDEQKKLVKTAKMGALVGAGVGGVIGGVALAAFTGIAVPAALITGGATLAGGAGAQLITETINMKRSKKAVNNKTVKVVETP